MNNEHTNASQDTAKQVDRAARLFDEHGGFIRSTLQYFVKDPSEQEELYQDLFVYFVRKPVPDDVQRIRGWLYRAILDRIRDRKRRQSRYRKRLETYAENCTEHSEAPDSGPAEREQIETVFEQIKKYLSERQACAILYRFQQHLELDEIARRMNVDSRTVTHYVSVGLRKLRMRLNKDDKHEGDTYGL